MKSARRTFSKMIQTGSIKLVRGSLRKTKTGFTRVKKRRTAKQRAATRRLIAFNKRRRR